MLYRYVLHLYDVSHEGIWEKRGIYTYYTELVFELGSNIVDFLHHLHMLVSSRSVSCISTICFYIYTHFFKSFQCIDIQCFQLSVPTKMVY